MKKNLTKLITIICLLLVQNNSAQANFTEGYVINKHGDTIHGYIDYKNWTKNPDKITFKKNLEDSPTVYTPQNIKAFNTNNLSYISKTFEVETSSRNNNNLSDNPNLKLKTITAFLQILFKEDKSLYYFNGFNENFYIAHNNNLILLTHKKYLKKISTIHKNDKYKGQLQLYLNDCPSIESVINHSTYNLVNLSKIFKMYYKCTDVTPDFAKTSKIKVEKGVFIGVSSSSLKFDNNDQFKYLNEKFKNSFDISGGLFFNIVLSENPATWSLNSEIQYYTYKTSNRYIYFENENINTTVTSKINHSFIKLNLLPRYKFPFSNKVSMYLNGGPTIGFALSEENYKKSEHKVFSNETTTIDSAMPSPTNQEIGLIFGSGVEFNNLSIEARYELTNGVTSRSANGSLNKFFLLIGYKI